MAQDLTSKTFGKYELRERLGSGGMAEVYKAYHATLDRFVAIKILHPFLREDPTFKERFEREARSVARLRHPNIVQVYDFDQDPETGQYYMVMEYIDGPTLSTELERLRAQGQWMTIPHAISITRDLASALAYAHAHNMVHRDVKPANVMIDSDGRIVLTDFGIARMVTGPQMTASGTMVGTPAYMSPEQGLGQLVDHRSDIYSLGVVLYQLAAGGVPYDADTPIAVVLMHVQEPLPPPSSINPEIPPGLERVIYKALAKSPDERYQRIEELSTHLSNLEEAATLAIPPSTISGLAPEAQVTLAPELMAAEAPPSRRFRAGIWLAVASVVLLAVLAIALGIVAGLDGLLPTGPAQSIAEETSEGPLVSALTSTPNQQATLMQATIAALAATSAALAEPSATSLPDLTATVAACDYSYEIIEQSPQNGASRPDRTEFTQEITVRNDSRCPWGPDTQLVFVEDNQMDGPDCVQFDRILDPGEQYTIEIPLQTPALDTTGSAVQSTWQIVLPDGTQLSPPVTFRLTLYDRDILLTPAATNTPVATDTPEAPPASSLELRTWTQTHSCRRTPSNPNDYICDIELFIYGGRPPYCIQVNSLPCPPPDQRPSGPPFIVQIGARAEPECNSFSWSVTVIDDAMQRADAGLYFDVAQNYGAFVDGACP